MTIQKGDQIPATDVFVLKDGAPAAVALTEITAGRKVAIFGVPGAFTRTCSAQHLPGFVANAEALKAKGIDDIYCLAVNDVFVLAAWSREHDPDGKVTMLADGALNFTRATGLETDMADRGFGIRCRRFSMVVDNGIVSHMHLEEPGEFGATSAQVMLDDL